MVEQDKYPPMGDDDLPSFEELISIFNGRPSREELARSDRLERVENEIVSTVESDGGTWSLRGDEVPEEGYLVSLPLMSLARRGNPSIHEVRAWLWLNIRELSSVDAMRWRAQIRWAYFGLVQEPQNAKLFAGAWNEPPLGIMWLDVNLWYPPDDELRAKRDGFEWGQHKVWNLKTKEAIAVRRVTWERL